MFGCRSGPVYVEGWTQTLDPRFNDPTNPLYDPRAVIDSDWRKSVSTEMYAGFVDHVERLNTPKKRFIDHKKTMTNDEGMTSFIAYSDDIMFY